jgi:hypothetical protein
MSNTFLSPAALAPGALAHLSPEQRIALWADLLDTCDQFLLAGLRRKIGPDGDLEAAYRKWQDGYWTEHDRMIRHMMEELSRRSAGDVG